MKRACLLGFGLVLALGLAGESSAAPITYSGQLQYGVAAQGTISQPNDSHNNPIGAEYYSFSATAGTRVSVTGGRLDGGYDMAFWLFYGLFSNTDELGSLFDPMDTGYIAFADDELPPNVPGPEEDPQHIFDVLQTGDYTVAVVNFTSANSTAEPPYDFLLTSSLVDVRNVPEPASLGLLAIALAGLGFGKRRKRA